MFDTLILYAISSFAVTIIPGPTMLLALTNGTTKNKKIITTGVLGAACSDIILIGMVAFGLGTILMASETIFLVIKFIGVIYLIWLAYNLWISTPHEITVGCNKFLKPIGAFYKSLFVALSNPKGLLFFGAFLPQFVNIEQPQLQQYSLFIFLTVTIDIIVMAAYAVAGFQISRYFSIFKLKIVNRICAAIIVFIASGLALYRKTN